MGANSKIEWTDHTFNPWLGCVEVSPACDHCYARTLVTGRMGKQVWGKESPRSRTSADYWKQPDRWNREAMKEGVRKRVFCGSLCDVMEDRADLQPIREDLYRVIERTQWIDWLLLTKRPQNFRRFLPKEWLLEPRKNVWGMTTVESQEYLWRVEELIKTPLTIRGLSVEPLLGPLDLYRYLPWTDISTPQFNTAPDWVIVGGESGGGSRPMRAEWARSLRDQCVSAGVSFLFKQWGNHNADLVNIGKKAAGRILDGRTWDELPATALRPIAPASNGSLEDEVRG